MDVPSGGREMRGASYMDQYDAHNDDTGYDTRKESSEISGCAKCSKHSLFLVNFVMLLMGVALVVGILFVRENNSADGGNIEFAMSDTIVFLAIGAGALIILVSFLGCVGARTHARCILIAFIVLLVLCLAIEAAAVGVIFLDDSLLRDNIKTQWNKLSEEKQLAYEQDNDCSGFDECYESLEGELESNMYIIGGITIAIAVYQLAMTIFACCLCTRSKGQQNFSD